MPKIVKSVQNFQALCPLVPIWELLLCPDLGP